MSSKLFYSFPVTNILIPATFLLCVSCFFPVAPPLHVSVCLSLSPQCQVMWALCWCEGSSAAWALGSRWSALYHSQTDSCLISRALAGGPKKTERERERLKKGSFSISLSPSHMFSLKWSTHYHLYVLIKRVLALNWHYIHIHFTLI